MFADDCFSRYLGGGAMGKLTFEYFSEADADQYAYYRIPKMLITDARFKDLSTDAKLLYGLMLDRMSLSLKNGWFDEKGRVFIYFTIEDIMEQLQCRSQKATKLVSELDSKKGIGLIEKVKQGQGHPTMIYVKNFSSTDRKERKGR